MRLIDAEILFEKVGNIKPKNKSEYELLGKFMNMITNSTTVERSHGEWIEKSQFDRLCKNCGQQHIGVKRFANFCPNCGASMVKEGEKND